MTLRMVAVGNNRISTFYTFTAIGVWAQWYQTHVNLNSKQPFPSLTGICLAMIWPLTLGVVLGGLAAKQAEANREANDRETTKE